MIVRVTLEIALRQEFDYLVPEALADRVEIGTRVKVPFGHREVMGCVTAVVETSEHKNLRSISRIIGTQSLVTPKVLRIARWIAEYYCCAPETALKSVLPEAVRREKDGWKEQLHVTPLTPPEPAAKLTKRQQEIVDLLRQRGEMRLQQFAELAETTAETIRRLEDKGYLRIAQKTMERDPYANEQIVPTQQLVLSAEQKVALDEIIEAMGGAGLRPALSGVAPVSGERAPAEAGIPGQPVLPIHREVDAPVSSQPPLRPDATVRSGSETRNSRPEACATRTRFHQRITSFKNRPVCDPAIRAIASGLPCPTIVPPPSPASGPRSMTQSASAIRSRLCSMTMTEWPASTRRWMTSTSFRTSDMWSPMVGSSRMKMSAVGLTTAPGMGL